MLAPPKLMSLGVSSSHLSMAVKRFDLITGISIVARVLYNLEQVYVVTTGSELLLISKSFLLDSNKTSDAK